MQARPIAQPSRLRIGRLVGLGLCLLAAGCGGSKFKQAAVSGQVTAKGQPVPEASVTFQPQGGGPGSYGQTDAQGRFSLRSVLDDSTGAVVGTHTVTITTAKAASTQDDAGSGMTGEMAPERFRDGSVQFTVPPGGSDQANFELLAP
ncbi:MAG: carboxypeptidase-like regulatory domain-containing protein [Patescibacteria group bacterium]|nr:carboxypeptidase-like regulatory domain-containing protein [Patescibacteria group bacterium]